MTSAMEVLWKQALKTFSGRNSANFKLCQKNFEKLRALINNISAEDVKLEKQVLDFVQMQSAPMCVIDIFENQDITIAVFILKHGVTMPMHDHPGMHGLLKVIAGVIKIDSYSMQYADGDHIIKPNEEITAVKHPGIIVKDNDDACVLTPSERNLHEISCVEGPAAFLDILSPPYNVDEYGKGSRLCTFFRIISSQRATNSDEKTENVQLMVIDSPPDFYSRSLKYLGPPLR
ncbi:2-aminoethanethiol dioxygenase [Cephus cinctus]|uniref:2-aminoethanethiol dioxygenase n=1 Tax=Cephus cinctus TaxID=211228 RepID=A0AAJ7BGI6_CEPCN|nr:2-aminoethanethiol dioxygenase [Cephus cinctus]